VIRTSRSADRIKVTFSLPLHDAATRCSVVGDFNGWVPGAHELRRRTNGTRSTSVVVPRGTRLRFRYLGEDGRWFNDPDAPHRDGADDVVVV
jgi:1,4-alpha-glucan branching enzyme